jgi:DNA-binding CsgD family transcriptional regulator
LCATIERCHRAAATADLEAIMQGPFRRLIPHNACVYGIGNMKTREHVLYRNQGFAPDMVDAIMSRFHLTDNVLFAPWQRSRTPQYAALALLPGDDLTDAQRRWRELLLSHGYEHLAMHGVIDNARGYSSFFFLGELAQPLSRCDRTAFEMLAPHLHHALLTLERKRVAASGRPPGPSLTLREKEVLHWLCLGKTNWETAAILAISELTVRNHVHNVMLKLGVTNRTQAALKALQDNLIAGPPPLTS